MRKCAANCRDLQQRTSQPQKHLNFYYLLRQCGYCITFWIWVCVIMTECAPGGTYCNRTTTEVVRGLCQLFMMVEKIFNMIISHLCEMETQICAGVWLRWRRHWSLQMDVPRIMPLAHIHLKLWITVSQFLVIPIRSKSTRGHLVMGHTSCKVKLVWIVQQNTTWGKSVWRCSLTVEIYFKAYD